MAGNEDLREFPAVSQKLAAPKKLSAFEKERQAAEAKRQREDAETAAALKAFQDDFAGEGEDAFSNDSSSRAAPSGPRGYDDGCGYRGGYGGGYCGGYRGGYGGNRGGGRFGGGPPTGPRSRPGGFGPPMPGLPPPPSMKRKRALDAQREADEARRELDIAYGRAGRSRDRTHSSADHMEEEERDDRPRPTLQLSSLPPDMTADDIQKLLADHVHVHCIDFLPPPGPGFAGKRSLTAIAALSPNTEKSKIDATVSALRGLYLGAGFCLSISQHLSSAALQPAVVSKTSAASYEPFGAKRLNPSESQLSTRNVPPPDLRGGFGPPDSYDGPVRGASNMLAAHNRRVRVFALFDMPTLRAIHVLAERLLTEMNPQKAVDIEAMLICDSSIRKDKRFAFLYDAQSPAGVYYRYLLWRPHGDWKVKQLKWGAQGQERVYDDTDICFAPPHGQLPFHDLGSLSDAPNHVDYDSSDEETEYSGDERSYNRGGDLEAGAETGQHLSALKRARLVHLLCLLPTSHTKLRKVEVARVTNFAINHAREGAEEIANLLILNVEKPFCYSLASKYEEQVLEQDDGDDYEPDETLPPVAMSVEPTTETNKKAGDPSKAKLVALYIITDVLSAALTTGAKNAWKYRQLFESGLKQRNIFGNLGRIHRKSGRITADQWKRQVSAVFDVWERRSVFSSETHRAFEKSFMEPPLTEEERAIEAKKKAEDKRAQQDWKLKSKFKRVGDNSASASPAPVAGTPSGDSDMPMADADGSNGQHIDCDAMQKEIVSSEAMDVMPSDVDAGVSSTTVGDSAGGDSAKISFTAKAAPKPAASKKRMRGEDMFAFASDDDDE
jgi:U2-associated protein SR140